MAQVKADLDTGWMRLSREFPPAMASVRGISACSHCIMWALFNDQYNHEPSATSKYSSLTRIRLGKCLAYSKDTVTDAIQQLMAAKMITAFAGYSGTTYAINTKVGDWQNIDAAAWKTNRAGARTLAKPAQSPTVPPTEPPTVPPPAVTEAGTSPSAMLPTEGESGESAEETPPLFADQGGENSTPRAEKTPPESGENSAIRAGLKRRQKKEPPNPPFAVRSVQEDNASAAGAAGTGVEDSARAVKHGSGGGSAATLNAGRGDFRPDGSPKAEKNPLAAVAPLTGRIRTADAPDDPHAWVIRAGIGELGRIYCKRSIMGATSPGAELGYEAARKPVVALAHCIRVRWVESINEGRFANAVAALCAFYETRGEPNDPAAYLISVYRGSDDEESPLLATWLEMRGRDALPMPPLDPKAHAEWQREWEARERVRIAAERQKSEQHRAARNAELRAAEEQSQSARDLTLLEAVRAMKKTLDPAEDAHCLEYFSLVGADRGRAFQSLRRWLEKGRPPELFSDAATVTMTMQGFTLEKLHTLRMAKRKALAEKQAEAKLQDETDQLRAKVKALVPAMQRRMNELTDKHQRAEIGKKAPTTSRYRLFQSDLERRGVDTFTAAIMGTIPVADGAGAKTLTKHQCLEILGSAVKAGLATNSANSNPQETAA
jgi:hypothetical protein